MLARPRGSQGAQSGALARADHLERRDGTERAPTRPALTSTTTRVAAVERDDVQLAADLGRPGVPRDDAPAPALELAGDDSLGVGGPGAACLRSWIDRRRRRFARGARGASEFVAVREPPGQRRRLASPAVLASVQHLRAPRGRGLRRHRRGRRDLRAALVLGRRAAGRRRPRVARAGAGRDPELGVRLPAVTDHRQPRARRPPQGRPRVRPRDRRRRSWSRTGSSQENALRGTRARRRARARRRRSGPFRAPWRWPSAPALAGVERIIVAPESADEAATAVRGRRGERRRGSCRSSGWPTSGAIGTDGRARVHDPRPRPGCDPPSSTRTSPISAASRRFATRSRSPPPGATGC